jgi:hypothetical protein
MSRPLEEAYFAQLNAERRQKIRAELAIKARELAAEAAVAEALRTDDVGLVRRLRALGFDEDTVRVLDLLPLVWVSWADGKTQREERIAVMELMIERGIEYESDAWMLIESLLEERPSDAYLEEALTVLRALRMRQPGALADIVELCHAIAQVSGGLFELGTIGKAERSAVERVAAILGTVGLAKLHQLID